jgi:hypothetical protein
VSKGGGWLQTLTSGQGCCEQLLLPGKVFSLVWAKKRFGLTYCGGTGGIRGNCKVIPLDNTGSPGTFSGRNRVVLWREAHGVVGSKLGQVSI